MRFALFLLALFAIAPVAEGEETEALEEAQREGALNLLDEAAADDPSEFSLYATDSLGEQRRGPEWQPRARLHRARLRWVRGPYGTALRLKLSGEIETPVSLRPHVLVQAEGQEIDARGALGVGPLQAGHLELSWGEGITLGLGERNPYWATGPPRPRRAFVTEPWPWLGPAEAPVSVVAESHLPGRDDLRCGSFWIRSTLSDRNAFQTYGAWVVRGFDAPSSHGPWVGLLLLDGGRADPANLSLACGWKGASGWISGEVAGDRRLRACALRAAWNQRRSAGLHRIALRLRWDREGPWTWSCDPRRPSFGRTRLAQVHTRWRLGGHVDFVAETVCETRWSDPSPVPTQRQGLHIVLSMRRPLPMRPNLRLTLRRSTQPRWAQALGRMMKEEVIRLTSSLRMLSSVTATVGMRAGISQVSREDPPASHVSSGSVFWEWHGWWTARSWTLRWTLGAGSGDAGAGRWLGLYPDASGWIPLPAVAPSLWFGAGLERGLGLGYCGFSARAQVREGALRTTWGASIGWKGS